MDNNNYDYTVKLYISREYNNKNIKVGSTDPYIINHIKKIVDNVKEVVNQMELYEPTELNDIYIKLPFDSHNPVILGSEFTNITIMKYYRKYYHYTVFDKKISPLNISPKTDYRKHYACRYLPIQLLDYILNFDNILDVIYHKLSNDRNIHIFMINPDLSYLSIDYMTTDKSLYNKLIKMIYSGLNNIQKTEEFVKIVSHIFHSPVKSARN